MTYLSGKTQKRKQWFRYFLIVAFFAALITFWTTSKSLLHPVFEPIVIYYNGTKEVFKNIPEFFSTYVTSRKNLIEKDKTLEITIENLENELAEKNAKLEESVFLTGEDGLSSASALVLYPLAQDITRIYQTVLLSKGYKDGVEKDSYVYIRGLQPVCIIEEVYTLTSLCELLSASGETTEAVILSSSSTEPSISLTLTGRGGGAFLGDVARDTPIIIGSPVFLKSDQSMKLGTVVDVIHNNQDTSWRVFVRGAYNPVTSSIFYLHKK